MVFSSLIFLYLFLPLSFALHFLTKNTVYRNWALIITSLCFYAWGEPIWICLLIFSTSFDYLNAIFIEKHHDKWQSKAGLAASVVVNLSLLGFFKYWGFIVQNINYVLGLHIPFRDFGLPIGISFYTFQTLSYVIDVYRREVPAQKSFYKLLLFVSLFHQLVAGPIVRYKDIAEEIENKVITTEKFSEGISRFAVGLGKKVIFANTAGEVAEFFLNGNFSDLSVLGAWFGISLFALQIYFDFSGYSDMAIGLGKMFGFTYKENFNYPYISRSCTEFWRRWHISLGSFFRYYLYIPLGGNQRNVYRNLFIVWFLTGLWHGASWNFVLWGVFFGVLIMTEKLGLLNELKKAPAIVSHIYLIVAVLVGWVFFYFTNLSSAFLYLGIMFGFSSNALINSDFAITFTNNSAFFVLALIACTPVVRPLHNLLSNITTKRRLTHFAYNSVALPIANFAIMLISTTLLVGKTYNPFLYFRF